jgi:hypothetical protein
MQKFVRVFFRNLETDQCTFALDKLLRSKSSSAVNGAGIAVTISPNMNMVQYRGQVLKEFLDEEKEYVKELQTINQTYLQPLAQMKWFVYFRRSATFSTAFRQQNPILNHFNGFSFRINPNDLNQLNGNIEAIIANHHELLFETKAESM